MKKSVYFCDNCNKQISDSTYCDINNQDFCNKECLNNFYTKQKYVKCPTCNGRCYTYIDAGYGDNDKICVTCNGKGQIKCD